ncbi:MAG: hypothetical protein KJZ91_29680 [Myxococcales bacterium]|nr:hypothetical protein [Myxococcales bacterium]
MGRGQRLGVVVLVSSALAGAACSSARSDAGHERPLAAPPATREAAATAWDDARDDVAAERARLAVAWRAASTPAERAAVRDQASRFLVATLVDRLVPPWLGMPWGLGRDSTATRPHQPGKTIACSYFVGAVLQGAGFTLRDRFRLGQAAALVIQRSLVGGAGKVNRFLSIPPAELATRLAALDDGVYIIGLDVHVGLVVVRGDEVRFVHASYTGDQVVTDEPLATAAAIARSQPRGYFVSPLVTTQGVADDWLVERWLEGDPVGP